MPNPYMSDVSVAIFKHTLTIIPQNSRLNHKKIRPLQRNNDKNI